MAPYHTLSLGTLQNTPPTTSPTPSYSLSNAISLTTIFGSKATQSKRRVSKTVYSMRSYQRTIKRNSDRHPTPAPPPQEIPDMQCIALNKDADTNQHHVKSQIFVQENLGNLIFHKSKHFAIVLSMSSTCILISRNTKRKFILQQGDCKNDFCNATLPADEVATVHPP